MKKKKGNEEFEQEFYLDKLFTNEKLVLHYVNGQIIPY